MATIEHWRNSTPFFGAANLCKTNLKNFRGQNEIEPKNENGPSEEDDPKNEMTTKMKTAQK